MMTRFGRMGRNMVEQKGAKMTKITGERKAKITNAIKEARRQRDLCNGSVWSNLVRLLGEKEADVAMMNLMWADAGFAPALKR
jgi:hypothetical protein